MSVPLLDKLIPRLASNHDGEVVATARAIERVLRNAGLDWHDLAKAVTNLTPATPIDPEPELLWNELAKYIRERDAECSESLLSKAEKEFVDRMTTWRKLTERQQEWLRNIARRVFRERAAA